MEFITFLSNHPQYAGAILIILMMMESAPVIGFFIPGTFILPLLGAMAASSSNSFWYLFICALSGAFLGDMLGFWLGRLGAHRWQPRLFNSRRQRAAKHAHELLQKHGLLALFLGRFVWLIHPAIPGAAGLFGIKLLPFIAVDLLAIFCWILLYMGAGHMLTGLWLKQTVEFVEILSLIITILLVLWGLRRMLSYRSQRYPSASVKQQQKK